MCVFVCVCVCVYVYVCVCLCVRVRVRVRVRVCDVGGGCSWGVFHCQPLSFFLHQKPHPSQTVGVMIDLRKERLVTSWTGPDFLLA